MAARIRVPEPEPGLLPESWRVRLPIFEGPLDLLLHLVKINEMEITDIPLATICDQYHEYLSLMEEMDLDIAGEYIYEAALLIQLKSRLLLPCFGDEEGGGEDPRQELVARLLEYQRLKDAAATLAEIHRLRQGVWVRKSADLRELTGEEDRSTDLDEISLFDLLCALREVLSRYDREHPPALLVERECFSVRDELLRLLRDASRGRPLDLLLDLRRRSCRGQAIAAFLAVLEMLRLHLVRLHQAADGGILLYRTKRELQAEELEAIRP